MQRRRKKKGSVQPVLRRRVPMSKMELARQYYWCDELDFYKMRAPITEVMAFCNYEYITSPEYLPDVLHYYDRIARAQSHGQRYIIGRMICKLAVEDPEDALPGFEYAPEG